MLNILKFAYSTTLLAFCVALVGSCIFTSQTVATANGMHPALAFLCFVLLIAWLAVMEGGQGCLVGLKSVSKSRFKESHPITHRCCRLAHRNDNLERFIVGRQFLVVLTVFLINMMAKAISAADPLGLPAWVNAVFLENSLAVIITTIDAGQLPAQVTAAVAMLDFIQNYAMLATIHVSLLIEASGLLHSVYLVQILFHRISGSTGGKSGDDAEPRAPKTTLQAVFFWLRVLLSLVVLVLAFAVTIQALLLGKSGMWEGVSPGWSILIFFVLLTVAGIMEGMQIAAFALLNMPEEELLRQSPMAHANCQLVFEGKGLQSFLIGRQMFVAALMFIVARIATIQLDEGDENLFGVSDAAQSFLDTGLLGAVILTIFGSLVWRIIASAYPLNFMANPAIAVIVRTCFFLEATGICSASWLIALAMKWVFRLKNDHEHLGNTTSIDPPVPELDEAAEQASKAKQEALSSSRRSRRSSVLSSRELAVVYSDLDNLEIDEIDENVEKLESSIVRSARLSAVLSSRDITAVVDEFDGEYGANAPGNEEEEDDDDDIDGWYDLM